MATSEDAPNHPGLAGRDNIGPTGAPVRPSTTLDPWLATPGG